jgi:cytoskeletal protein CcmA (bactofilin family)
VTAATGATTAAAAPDRPARRPAPASSEPATIGRSITIRGDVTGDEDLMIQGTVDGTVDLEKHNVTVGPEGRVKANISGRTVTIEGEVEGNVRGQEQVVLRSVSKVTGDIVAPRVVLEDGATFLGSIDMSRKPSAGGAPKPAAVRDEPTPPPKTDSSSTSASSAMSKG